MTEPKTKNSYRVPPAIWRRLGEVERAHFNKFFVYVYYHQEAFNDGPVINDPEWHRMAKKLALYSTDVVRRGMAVDYWNNKRL